MTNCNLSVISVTESFFLAGLNNLSVMIDLIEFLIPLIGWYGDSSLVEGCADDGSVHSTPACLVGGWFHCSPTRTR